MKWETYLKRYRWVKNKKIGKITLPQLTVRLSVRLFVYCHSNASESNAINVKARSPLVRFVVVFVAQQIHSKSITIHSNRKLCNNSNKSSLSLSGSSLTHLPIIIVLPAEDIFIQLRQTMQHVSCVQQSPRRDCTASQTADCESTRSVSTYKLTYLCRS